MSVISAGPVSVAEAETKTASGLKRTREFSRCCQGVSGPASWGSLGGGGGRLRLLAASHCPYGWVQEGSLPRAHSNRHLQGPPPSHGTTWKLALAIPINGPPHPPAEREIKTSSPYAQWPGDQMKVRLGYDGEEKIEYQYNQESPEPTWGVTVGDEKGGRDKGNL